MYKICEYLEIENEIKELNENIENYSMKEKMIELNKKLTLIKKEIGKMFIPINQSERNILEQKMIVNKIKFKYDEYKIKCLEFDQYTNKLNEIDIMIKNYEVQSIELSENLNNLIIKKISLIDETFNVMLNQISKNKNNILNNIKLKSSIKFDNNTIISVNSQLVYNKEEDENKLIVKNLSHSEWEIVNILLQTIIDKYTDNSSVAIFDNIVDDDMINIIKSIYKQSIFIQ